MSEKVEMEHFHILINKFCIYFSETRDDCANANKMVSEIFISLMSHLNKVCFIKS